MRLSGITLEFNLGANDLLCGALPMDPACLMFGGSFMQKGTWKLLVEGGGANLIRFWEQSTVV